MAYTVSRVKSVFGNEAVVHLTIDADAATQTVESGLKNITAHTVTPGSMGTYVGWKVVPNSGASGVQSYGVLGLSGFTSGDRVFITVFGTR